MTTPEKSRVGVNIPDSRDRILMHMIAQALGGQLSTSTKTSGGAIFTFQFYDRYIASVMMDVLEHIKNETRKIIEFTMKPGQAYSQSPQNPDIKKYLKAPGSKKRAQKFYIHVHEWNRR